MKKFLLFSFLLTLSFGLVAQTKSKSKSRKTSNQVRTEMQECNWCGKSFRYQVGYYLGKRYNGLNLKSIESLYPGDSRQSLINAGYTFYCSKKCGHEYISTQ
jgi:hypothetical protein